MATFAVRAVMAKDETLRERMQCALILTALAVANEPRPAADATADARSRSNVRRAFVRLVLADPAGTVPRLRWVLACTPLVDIVAPTDDDLAAAVASVWDALAGA